MSFFMNGSAAPIVPEMDHLAKVPTPFHVFYADRALEDARSLEKGLRTRLQKPEFFYSTKTNPLPHLLQEVLALGWGLEAVGAENLRVAIESGAKGNQILFNGAAWRKQELERAIFELGISHFSVDSPDMVDLLAAVLENSQCRPLNLAIRLHDGESHFGFPLEKMALEYPLSRIPADRVASWGFQIHRNPQSSSLSKEQIKQDFRQRCERVKRALLLLGQTNETDPISFLDFGGGIDSPYVYRVSPGELGSFHNPNEAEAFRSSLPSERFSLFEAGSAVAEAIHEELGHQWCQQRILFEPGRSVCTRALSTVIEVRAVKNLYPDAQLLITDGSTSFLGPLHRGIHPLWPKGNRRTFVYGCLPHSGDWLFQAVNLPQLKRGDRLLIEHTGAYFLPLESDFGHAKPGILSCKKDEWIRTPKTR